MLDNGKIVIKNDKGEELVCDVLFTFDSDETNKSYIAYTDNSKDESGNTKVYASTYTENGEEKTLAPIETDKEWKIIEKILEELQNSFKEQMSNSDNSGE